MHASPESTVLLLCIRPHQTTDTTASIRSLIATKLNWAELLEKSDYHHVTPIVSNTLRSIARDLIDNDIAEEIQQRHRLAIQHNLVLATNLLKILNEFRANGIDVIAFKGPVFAAVIYGDLAKRASGDIDLLVRPDQFDAAEKLLNTLNYESIKRYENDMQTAFCHSNTGVAIDLHWGVPPKKLEFKVSHLWSNAESVTLLGQPVPTFGRVDILLIAAINAVKEYWKPSLHHLCDITALTAQYQAPDWDDAFSRAAKIGCTKIFATALRMAQEQLTLNYSKHVVKLINRVNVDPRVITELNDHLYLLQQTKNEIIAKRLFHFPSADAYTIALLDSRLVRYQRQINKAITPNPADHNWIKLPRYVSFLYYIIRPVRLTIKLIHRYLRKF